ncbi:MAG: RsmD family RNA methyltransferase [Desulfobacterales bacterium]|nr:RsmD family RNA methyltransferase [Desulfobacterales bacterium]
MRIVGGDLRGKRLASVPGLTTRPTSDRIRESIFDIITHRVRGAVVLDLFAGTGALGIEALSRGAGYAVFIDQSRKALAVVERNIRSCNLGSRAKIMRWDILDKLTCLRSIRSPVPFSDPVAPSDPKGPGRRRMDGDPVFDLVLMDPPYHQNAVEGALHRLHESRTVVHGALIVVEHASAESISEKLLPYEVADERKYGRTRVSFLRYRVENGKD